jgi:hypothetical protein
MADNGLSLMLCQNASTSVHRDIEAGQTLALTSKDLKAAQQYLSQIDDGTSEKAQAQASVDSAQADYNSYQNTGASVRGLVGSSYQAATSVPTPTDPAEVAGQNIDNSDIAAAKKAQANGFPVGLGYLFGAGPTDAAVSAKNAAGAIGDTLKMTALAVAALLVLVIVAKR